MPKITESGGKTRYSIERFDGGLNTKNNVSDISAFESPDCLNVVFDDQGAVTTRDGSKVFNTTAIGSFTIDWGISYNQTMIVWSNGTMYRSSGLTGSTFTAISNTTSKFTTGVRVAAIIYQNLLFTSDGTNGPWKYNTSGEFRNMGIDTPSAPTGASIGAGSLSTGTYYYKVSFINSQVVEGSVGSASVAVTLTGSSTARVSSIPVGSTLAGVAQRFVYRSEAASGPFRKVGSIADNTTTTFDDTIANGAEGKQPIDDGTKPDAFKTIALHKERLFFDSAVDRTFARYTEIENPFIAPLLNEEPINSGDGEDIQAVASQDDLVTFFKKNKTFGIVTVDPADDTTWGRVEVPANIGIIGPKALCKVQNGIMFVGQQNNALTGFHFLTGVRIAETSDGKLRSLTISDRIEYDLLNLITSTAAPSITMDLFKNRLYMAHPQSSTTNNRIFWLDLNRVGSNGKPGSWAPWSGINANVFFSHNGLFFAGDSTETGFVRQLNAGAFTDSGSAINSYFWTKEIGGQDDGSLDSYIKDLRELYIWHEKQGDYYMNVRVRTDGDTSDGTAYPVYLDSGGSFWGTMVYGVDPWGGLRTDSETRIVMGFIGKRFQIRFDNQNTAGQSFKVHRVELGFNIRRRR